MIVLTRRRCIFIGSSYSAELKFMVTLHFFFCLGVITGSICHATENIMQRLEEELPGRIVVFGCTGVNVGTDARLY
jgi:hypothetical protein